MSVPEYYGKPERILRFERGNFHGSQKPSPIGYEPSSYRMGVAVHVRPMKEILQEYRGQAWRYEYRHVLPGSKTGCFHASELPVLFDMDMMGYSPDESSEKIGKHMRRIWGRFAYEGKPGWQEYRTGQETYIIE